MSPTSKGGAMIRKPAVDTNPTRISSRSLLFACLCVLVSSALDAQTEAIDLTAVFRAGGITIDQLMVYKISDIVLIRGRTSNVLMAAEAGRFATRLGYQRVANLIQIVPGLADSEIERYGERALDMRPELAGCSFQIVSIAGVV